MSILTNQYFKLKLEFEVYVDITNKGNGIFSYLIDSSTLSKEVRKELQPLLYMIPKTEMFEGLVRFYDKIPREFGE